MATGGAGRQPVGEQDGALSAPWAESLTRWLDDGFRVPGTAWRFGLDPILGLLLPGLGDTLTAVLAAALVHRGLREGVPKAVLARMVLNVAVDALVGTFPVVGDLFDFGWKANRRNMDLLDRYRSGARHEATAGDYAVLAGALLALVAVVAVPLALGAALLVWLFGDGR